MKQQPSDRPTQNYYIKSLVGLLYGQGECYEGGEVVFGGEGWIATSGGH